MNTIILQKLFEEKKVQSSISHFFQEVQLGKLLQKSNFTKARGFSCLAVFQFIFTLVFSGKNLYQTMLSTTAKEIPAKDTVYRFLNSSRFNWRKLLLLLSSQVIKNKIKPLTSEKREHVLIIDDTFYDRSRSKQVELLSNVFDHAKGIFAKGFRLLTVGWSDGNTFIPVAFSLLSSEKKKNRLCEMSDQINKHSNGFKRRKESIKKSTDVLFDLLAQVKEYSIPARYVLFDSWFAFPSIIKKVRKYDLHAICMVKNMPKVLYTYRNKRVNLEQLYASVIKRCGRAKILASVQVSLGSDSEGKPVHAKIVFVRNRNKNREWLALLTTDITLPDEEIVRIYGKRWNIEVFFKMVKSYLHLAGEFQGRSYDMMFAHSTIVFIRYIMIALESRYSEDSKAFGGMFFQFCDELEDIKFSEAFQLIIKLLVQALNQVLMMSDDQVNKLLDCFISSLPAFYINKLTALKCES